MAMTMEHTPESTTDCSCPEVSVQHNLSQSRWQRASEMEWHYSWFRGGAFYPNV